MNKKEYDLKMLKRQGELLEEEPQNEIEKAIHDLEFIITSIRYGSSWFRWGYVKSLKLAIKVLTEINKGASYQ